MYSLAWMGDVLRLAGNTVKETPRWQDRGRGEFGPVKGVLMHHTAGALVGNMPSLPILINGRGAPNPLPGPLCNLGVARDGTFYTVAAGKANHAGYGLWHGVSDGNGQLIGIECENTGLPNDKPWPVVQVDAMVRGVAALVKHIGCSVQMVAGHKEYALPAGRKPDPDFDMNQFRTYVDKYMGGMPPVITDGTTKYRVVNIEPPDMLSVRNAPNGAVIGKIPLHTVVTAINEQVDRWSHVKTPAGHVGWVYSKYLERVA